MRKSKLAVLVAIATVVSAIAVLPAAHAQVEPDYKVQVAAGFPVGKNCDPETFRGCRFGESMRFFSGGVLKVHQGDTIQFTSDSFHTATLLPENTDAFRWLNQNAPPVGGPWSLLSPDPDDGPGALKANNRAIFGPQPPCLPDTPCNYDGSEVVNSGILVFGPPEGMTVTVNADPGDFFWVLCLVHTHMRMRVEVVADSEPTSSQAEIDAVKAQQIALDQEWGNAADTRLSARRAKHVTADGKTVWDVFVGYDNHFVSLFGMYPRRLRIDRGQTVRFHFSQLIYEDHTATMPRRKAIKLAQNEFFVPQCDPDGDTGDAPDTPPDLQGPPFCSGGPQQLEFDISARTASEHGDGVFRGAADLENSGIRGAQASLSPYDVRFGTRTSRKGVGYICLIHPFMRGRIAVR